MNPERFWSKVNRTSDCWLWTAATNGRYGVIGRGGRGAGMAYAHRVSWELSYGTIPEGQDVCHHCDIPRCVRPDHLFVGSRSENMQDCKAKGRWNEGSRGSAGEANGRALLSDEQVSALRADRAVGMTYLALSHKYGVGKTQVGRLVKREQRP